MSVWKAEQLPEFVNCILIDRVNNNKQSHLPHTHHNELELFYVYTGEGQYMVDNRLYPIRGGGTLWFAMRACCMARSPRLYGKSILIVSQ